MLRDWLWHLNGRWLAGFQTALCLPPSHYQAAEKPLVFEGILSSDTFGQLKVGFGKGMVRRCGTDRFRFASLPTHRMPRRPANAVRGFQALPQGHPLPFGTRFGFPPELLNRFPDSASCRHLPGLRVGRLDQ